MFPSVKGVKVVAIAGRVLWLVTFPVAEIHLARSTSVRARSAS